MLRTGLAITAGSFGTVALMVAAMWGWLHAADVVSETTRPEVALWAVRCAAIAIAAGAQALLLTFVIGSVYGRGRTGDVLNGCAAVVFMLALASATALGLAAGR